MTAWVQKPLRALGYAYCATAGGLEWVAPLSLLLFRVWVADAFWRAGLVKIADMNSTVMLFQYVYHVAVLPPVFAAHAATFIELVFPWLLFLGLAGRFAAGFLFIYNIITVVSYSALWPHGLWTGIITIGSSFDDAKVWGMMLLAVACFGPGKLSIDEALRRWIWPRLGCNAPVKLHATDQ